MAIRVNTVSISASSTAATPYAATIPAGTGIVAGDLLIVNAVCDGTHASHGMTVQDSVNTTNFSNIGSDVQLGGGSASWQQTFYYAAAANIPDGSTITLTPYASATHNSFTVDIFRYALGDHCQRGHHLQSCRRDEPVSASIGCRARYWARWS